MMEKAGILTLKRNIKYDYAYNEAIKTLRANIQFCGNNIRVVMFTSALPDEGKSDISFSLAQALSQIGKKTLVIDADIRKSVLATRYNANKEQGSGEKKEINGLSQYLSGQKTLEEVIYGTESEFLDVIFSGPYSPNPAELLEENLFSEMLAFVKGIYDYVIIDTPPMANLIDGAVVARNCDGAVMVIESGAVSYRLEQKVKEQIEASGCRILGAVLNKVDLNAEGYYGKYGKYGKYSRYGKYGKYGKYKKYDRYGLYGPYGYGYGHKEEEPEPEPEQEAEQEQTPEKEAGDLTFNQKIKDILDMEIEIEEPDFSK